LLKILTRRAINVSKKLHEHSEKLAATNIKPVNCWVPDSCFREAFELLPDVKLEPRPSFFNPIYKEVHARYYRIPSSFWCSNDESKSLLLIRSSKHMELFKGWYEAKLAISCPDYGKTLLEKPVKSTKNLKFVIEGIVKFSIKLKG
jgi:hypothetical protein